MDIGNLMSNSPITEMANLRAAIPNRDTVKAAVDGDEQKKWKIAQRFEAIFIHKMLEQMKSSTLESGLLEDSSSKQIKGMYWSFMADAVAENGGIGLAEQIYQHTFQDDSASPTPEKLDENI